MAKKYTGELILEEEINDSFQISSSNGKKETLPSVHRLRYHRIYFMRQASGALYIDERIFQLTGPSLFLLSIGQTFTFQPESRFDGYQLSFGDCFWERSPASANNCKAVLFNNVNAHQQLPVEKADNVELEFLFQTLSREYNKGNYSNKLDALAAYLKIIMIKIANINDSLLRGYDSPDRQLYRQFLDLVHHQYRTSRDVAEYAGRLNISPRKLSDLCRDNGGKGAKEIINDQLIAEAKRFLQFSSRPVKEIAFDLNFHTPEQFSHFFKTHARVSPLLYRETYVNIDR
jgi:AraC family transcriptional activator of pobA